MPRQKSSSKDYYYVTTPIYYANGHPHLGNTYTTTLADALTRFHRFLGEETFFLTGTDEHGDKVHQAAVAAGKTPLQFTTEVSELFKRTWKELGLEYSRFIRTTEEQHKSVVSSILAKIHAKGDIYFGEYGGLYCVGCERFLTEKELVDGKCPDHQTVPQFVSEKNYFFRMSKYQDALIHHIKEVAPDFIRPERYRNEVLAMLREPLEDLCISRPKSRLTWGIELPFDSNYVTYVWFDALINYLSGIGYPDDERFGKFWPNCEHLVAKDIIKPHGIFWPAMLLAADIPLYKHLSVHGYWVTPTGKMSKSLGNVVDPVAIKNEYGMDVFRYYVFREMVFGIDGTFNSETLEARYNADLANNLGNLVSRTLAMVSRYREGVVPKPAKAEAIDDELKQNASSCGPDVAALIERMELSKALERIWSLIDAANVYIDRTKPWTLAKDESNHSRLDTVLYYQAETLRVVASILTAFLPETSAKIFSFLGYSGSELTNEQTQVACSSWGRLKPGQKVEKGEALFPRSDLNGKADKASAAQAPPSEGLLSYDEFSKLDLRVGQILQAEAVPKSEKLVRLEVDLGDELGARQIIAGIRKHYAPEDLVGRKIAVVANLKPAKLMGLESRGMVLAASDVHGNLELVSVGAMLPTGSRIK